MFAAVLELDQFLKEEEEERREKEEKVSCPILQRNMRVCWTLCMCAQCTWEIEDYGDRECPLTYSKYSTYICEGEQTAELCPRLHWLCCKFEIKLHSQKSLTFVVLIQFEMVIHFICNLPAAVIVTEGGEKRGGGWKAGVEQKKEEEGKVGYWRGASCFPLRYH